MKITQYSFNIEHAELYGVNEAIMLQHFQFWITTNKINNRNFHDGRTWTYNSITAFLELYPFWTREQIRKILKNLINKQVLITGNYNSTPYDRTLWYAFKDENQFVGLTESICEKNQIDSECNTNQFSQKDKPIPVRKPDRKPNEKLPMLNSKNGDIHKSNSTEGTNERKNGNKIKSKNNDILKKNITVGDSYESPTLPDGKEKNILNKNRILKSSKKQKDDNPQYGLGILKRNLPKNLQSSKVITLWMEFIDQLNNKPNMKRISSLVKTLKDLSNKEENRMIEILQNSIQFGLSGFIPPEKYNGNGKSPVAKQKSSNFYLRDIDSEHPTIPNRLKEDARHNPGRYFKSGYLDRESENVIYGDGITTLRMAFRKLDHFDPCDPRTFEEEGDDPNEYLRLKNIEKIMRETVCS